MHSCRDLSEARPRHYAQDQRSCGAIPESRTPVPPPPVGGAAQSTGRATGCSGTWSVWSASQGGGGSMRTSLPRHLANGAAVPAHPTALRCAVSYSRQQHRQSSNSTRCRCSADGCVHVDARASGRPPLTVSTRGALVHETSKGLVATPCAHTVRGNLEWNKKSPGTVPLCSRGSPCPPSQPSRAWLKPWGQIGHDQCTWRI
jgi:hypothetical protein